MTTGVETRRRWTGELRYSELRRAMDFLEVTGKVEIKRANGIQRKGAHRYRNGSHVITVSTYLTVEQANRTLLHELTHAAQTERYGQEKYGRAYLRENALRGYKRNAFEVEARTASEFTDDFRITR